ncbi:hypothetical protein MHZ90_00230 [Pantoea sp. ACRSH]|uniref:hypothetical protein n=1 Tax=unclassified Pantoea TaxID=2630326 RepID=UPI001EF6C2A6|nr:MULTISPECIES: hypothetical protein [unclassified Pantoea]MCG7364583.1 hypothetical protein [Pantoea sp. ACRSH]MCG7395541.1 hypothetical protein [Pantoea sp. ACRSC]
MLRLLFLLIGAPVLRASWPALLAAGTLCLGASAAIVLESFYHATLSVPLCLLSLFLLAEGLIQAWRACARFERGWAAQSKALTLLLLGAALLAAPHEKGSCGAWLFALAFLLDGGFRIIACALMRCRRWHCKLAIGGGEWLLSLMIVTDWPLPHRVLIPAGFAVVLLGWALSLLQIAWQIRALPPETSVAALPLFTRKGVRNPHGLDYRHVPCDGAPASEPLTIYIWTPLGSGSVAGRRPWFDRWVAAIDHRGQVSTGHTSLAMGDRLYVSLYPVEDITGTLGGVLQMLHAREENDVAGFHQRSLEREIKEWCLPDKRLSLPHYNQQALINYWASQGQDCRYNLTSRNCSTSVMQALDVATEGLLGLRGVRGYAALLDPDFWLLSLIRSRAEGMTWTPGLVMDYVQVLRRVLASQLGGNKGRDRVAERVRKNNHACQTERG